MEFMIIFSSCAKVLLEFLPVHASKTFTDVLFLAGIIRCPACYQKYVAFMVKKAAQSLI